MRSWRFRRRLYGEHTVQRSKRGYTALVLLVDILLCLFLALWLVLSILFLIGVM